MLRAEILSGKTKTSEGAMLNSFLEWFVLQTAHGPFEQITAETILRNLQTVQSDISGERAPQKFYGPGTCWISGLFPL
jgi:hypothetical protein